MHRTRMARWARGSRKWWTAAALALAGPLVAMAQSTTDRVEADALFDWAEYTYPDVFYPAGGTTSTAQGYLVRYYAGSGSYLGYRDGVAYGYGAFFDGLRDIGGGIRQVADLQTLLPRMQASGFDVSGGEKLIVTEVVAKDAAGGADWFELYAAGTEAVFLGNYRVVDGGDDHEPVSLPALTLAPGDYLVVLATDESTDGTTPVVPFKLGGNDRVQLWRDGVLVDDLDWDEGEAPEGYSFGRYPGPFGSGMTLTPTPGSANWLNADGDVANGQQALGAVGTLVSSEAHSLTLTLDPAEYVAMVETYRSTGEKGWLEADLTIDGVQYEQVGVRLKGNSSLGRISADDDPATVPWLVKLDKYVDGQDHQGLEEFVIRSNNTSTSLNEAVALELLDAAGLASQDAIATALSVNGGTPVLRLVIEHPDNEWMAEEFASTGALYKAESTGDYSYRGDDPASYDEVFDQEAGKDNADLTPLIDFLRFINESDDATFKAGLADKLDVGMFAVYLAMQDLLNNSDDIDGAGNNSYLYYDTVSGRMTVVPWDYNLAFRGFGGIGGFPGGERPAPGDLPGGEGPTPGEFPGGGAIPPPGELPPIPAGEIPGGGGQGGQPGFIRGNILVERFLADSDWNALYVQQQESLRAALYASGIATAVLDTWQEIVNGTALVDGATVEAEAQAISVYFE